jgi:mRNA interferase MazF
MIKFRVGDIVSVEFPFSDLQTHKRRPGLVLLSSDVDLLVARVTTHPPRDPSDVPLNHWAEIGLPRASTIRLTKLATIDQRLVHHNIGRLHSEDSRTVAQAWQQLTASVVTELRE